MKNMRYDLFLKRSLASICFKKVMYGISNGG